MEDKRHIESFGQFNENLNISDVSDSEYQNQIKWNMIPGECEYNGKTYRILNIDMQGGYFTLYDTEAKKGEVQVLDDIDMEKCNPIHYH